MLIFQMLFCDIKFLSSLAKRIFDNDKNFKFVTEEVFEEDVKLVILTGI